MNIPHDSYPLCYIKLAVQLPGTWKSQHHPIVFEIRHADDCFEPLPRNREIPWEFREQHKAMEMRFQRERQVERLARQLAQKIMETIESRDPVNGYTPEENAAFNVQTDEWRSTTKKTRKSQPSRRLPTKEPLEQGGKV